MSKLEEMARLGAKVFAACTLRAHLDVHIVQVQQNADNSATFRVTDTQNTIGAVQEAVPAPGTQQYRLTSLLEPSIVHPCVIYQVPDGSKDRSDCWVPSSKSRQRPPKSHHSDKRQREGERHCAAGN